jgi:calcyclin binding protein
MVLGFGDAFGVFIIMDTERLELQQDLSEVDRLLARATRDYCKQVLVQERVRIMKELNQFSAPISVSEHNEEVWKTIEQFSWDQNADSVIVYVTCFKDFSSVSKENIKLEFTQNSFCVSVYGYNNINYKLKIANLSGNIREGKITTKSNGFTVRLKKHELGDWQSLVPKNGGSAKEIEVRGNEVDISQNLANLMKELYDEGNDEMKQMVKVMAPTIIN